MITVIAIVWNALVWGMLVPSVGPAIWFKSLFVLAGAGWVVGAVRRWIARHRGTSVTLHLKHDPVPHGTPTTAVFTFSRPLKAQTWSVLVTIEAPDDDLSNFGRIWERKLAVTTNPMMVEGELMVQSVSADFTLPADLPSSQDEFWYVAMLLQGDGVTWPFEIATRPKTARAENFQPDRFTDSFSSPTENTASPSSPPAPGAARPSSSQGKSLFRWAGALGILVLGWVVVGLVAPTVSSNTPPDDMVVSVLRDTVETVSVSMGDTVVDAGGSIATGNLSTRVDTREFGVLLTNWLTNDWRIRAHLQGVGKVEQGVLHLRIQKLALTPAGPCQPTGSCQVQSLRLLLSQATSDGSYVPIAQSSPLPWAIDLVQGQTTYRDDGVVAMKLPQNIAGDRDVRLQLKVQTGSAEATSDATNLNGPAYPSHGNHMALKLALRAAGPTADEATSDPCDQVGSLREAVQAHCAGQVQFRLDSRAYADRYELDAALIEAIKHYNAAAVRPLLRAGASPNAVDTEDKSATALSLAAAGDQREVITTLVKAGAKANQQTLIP